MSADDEAVRHWM